MRQRRPSHLPILTRNLLAQQGSTQKLVIANLYPSLRLGPPMVPPPKRLPLPTLRKPLRVLRAIPFVNPFLTNSSPIALQSNPRSPTTTLKRTPLTMQNQFTAIVAQDGSGVIAYCAAVAGANGQGETRKAGSGVCRR